MRIIFLLLYIITASGYASAQINYHFCDPPGDIITDPNSPTFDGFPGNWQRSHGTPSKRSSTMYMWSNLAAGKIIGEGIYQDNAFTHRGRYNVYVGLKSSTSNGNIKVLAATGLTPHTILVPQGTEPPGGMPQTLIDEWVGPIPPTIPSGLTHFWHAASNFYNPYDNGQVWIYPVWTSGVQFDFTLDYLKVCRVEAEPGATYSFGILPDGMPVDKVFYKIGSSFPSGFGVVINDKNKNTTHIANTFIDIAHNTYLEVANIPESINGHFYEGFIAPATECQFDMNMVCSPTPQGKSNNTAESVDASNEGSIAIEIYPNPSNGTFNVTLPDTDEYDITVSNVIGNIVYQARVSGGKHIINIPNAMPGNYIVSVSNGQFKEVKRIVVMSSN